MVPLAAPPVFFCYDQSVTSQSPWIPRPTTAHGTFGKETREQAGQVLAPGFKGCTPQSVLVFPGPGSYRNVPGSLGLQVLLGARKRRTAIDIGSMTVKCPAMPIKSSVILVGGVSNYAPRESPSLEIHLADTWQEISTISIYHSAFLFGGRNRKKGHAREPF